MIRPRGRHRIADGGFVSDVSEVLDVHPGGAAFAMAPAPLTELTPLAYWDAFFSLVCVAFPTAIVLIVCGVAWAERRWSVTWRLEHGRCPTCGSSLRRAPGDALLGPTVDRRVYCPRCEPRELCPVCGYDLRATPSRCPECGMQFEKGGISR